MSNILSIGVPIDPEITVDSIIEHNKTSILAALKGQGIDFIEYCYSGEGDDGSGIKLNSFEPAGNNDLSFQVEIIQNSSYWLDATKEWKQHNAVVQLPLEAAVETLLNMLQVKHGHQGYEHGDGGGGTFSLSVASGAYVYDHYDNIVEEQHSIHEG